MGVKLREGFFSPSGLTPTNHIQEFSMKRHLFAAISTLALGGLLVTGCSNGSPTASHDDKSAAINENSDKTELATSAVVKRGNGKRRLGIRPRAAGDKVFKLQVRAHNTFSFVKVWYNLDQFGGWVEGPCVDIRRKETWINTGFEVPNGVTVFFDGYRTERCPVRAADVQVTVNSPGSSNLTNWWVMVF
jgi:hypothetical protein